MAGVELNAKARVGQRLDREAFQLYDLLLPSSAFRVVAYLARIPVATLTGVRLQECDAGNAGRSIPGVVTLANDSRDEACPQSRSRVTSRHVRMAEARNARCH
jgi:hypothetical protein